jgi:hypothetical protein
VWDERARGRFCENLRNVRLCQECKDDLNVSNLEELEELRNKESEVCYRNATES